MFHRFIVIVVVVVRTCFGSISSKSFPFVSGTNITTKNRPTHDMQAYNQNAPCNPSDSYVEFICYIIACNIDFY